MYSKFRDDLPLISNVSVISGQIIWLAMLYDKIKSSMQFFMVQFENLINLNNYEIIYLRLNYNRLRAQTYGEMIMRTNHYVSHSNITKRH